MRVVAHRSEAWAGTGSVPAVVLSTVIFAEYQARQGAKQIDTVGQRSMHKDE